MIGTIGAILVAYASVALAKAAAAAKWPTTQGLILKASVQTEELMRERRETLNFFRPDVLYTYSVNGQEFTSDTLRVGLRSQARSDEARQMAAEYPPGKVVVVHYNPSNPADALLEPAVNSQTMAIVGSGVALIVVAMIMVLIRLGRT